MRAIHLDSYANKYSVQLWPSQRRAAAKTGCIVKLYCKAGEREASLNKRDGKIYNANVE